MPTITINTDETHAISQEGGTFVFRPQAELALIDLIKLRDFIDAKIDEAKKIIATTGETIDPNFKGVIGEHIRAIYRVYGEKYTYDKDFKEPLEQAGFLKKTEVYKADSKAINEYVKKHNALPLGVTLKDRQKVISLVVDKDEQTQTLVLTPESVDAGKD